MVLTRKTLLTSLGLLGAVALVLPTLAGSATAPAARASSHREAPLISTDPQADNTDLYAYISPDAPNSVTFVANYIPFETPDGAPNYFQFSDDVLYEINVDNVGDAKSHVTYQFKFKTTTQNQNTFLYPTGPITSLTDPDFNVRQTYTITEVVTPISGSPVSTQIGTNLPVPPINVGSKSTPNYDTLATAAIQTKTVGSDTIKIFAGPRDDPFWVDLGSIFDLLSLRPQAAPIGYPSGPTVGIDSVSGFNVHSLILQVPISRLMSSQNDPVLGVWATAKRPTTRVLSSPATVLTGGSTGFSTESGPLVQVSRLGMPLTNEVVLPRALKDAFNGLDPALDYPLYTASASSPAPFNQAAFIGAGALLKQSVLDPELQKLLFALYAVPNPGTNRTDLQAIFLQGMKTTKVFNAYAGSNTATTALPAGTNVNQPTKGTDGSGAGIVPYEALRLNTAAPFRPGTSGSICKPTPDYKLGLLGGDVCGFPNGRRLQDDVTHIELIAVAGAAYSVLTSGTFAYNAALTGVLTDGVTQNDKPFLASFPYVASPNQGQEWNHQALVRTRLLMVMKNTLTDVELQTVGPR